MTVQLAMIAHDRLKDDLVGWARANLPALARHEIVATRTTGTLLRDTFGDALRIETVLSGPQGGDQQIGARIAEGQVNALIFLVDPLSPHPHDVDVKALLRLATLHSLPSAYNLATADAVLCAVSIGRTTRSV